MSTKTQLNEYPGTLCDEITFGFPELTYPNKQGKNQQWRIIVRIGKKTDNNDYIWEKINDETLTKKYDNNYIGWVKVINKTHLGNIKKTIPDIITSGKNIGKTNETNVFTQAMSEAESKYTKQKRKITKEEKTTTTNNVTVHTDLYPPMLAKKLSDAPEINFNEPVFVQRKYNGVRVVSCYKDNKVIMYSRNRLEYSGLDKIKADIKPIFEKYQSENNGKHLFLDGEIYEHGKELQYISGVVRKLLSHDDTEIGKNLKYYIYDCFIIENGNIIDMNFADRNELINTYLTNNKTLKYVIVPTYKAENMDDIKKYYDQFLDEKYEGAIIRQNMPYEFSFNSARSNSLLKLKPKLDDEFLIVNYTKATKGKSDGALMFVLETNDHKQFTLLPSMQITKLKNLYKQMDNKEPNGKTHFENKYKNKKLTVYYDELSKDGIPVRFSTQDSLGKSILKVNGNIIRDYE